MLIDLIVTLPSQNTKEYESSTKSVPVRPYPRTVPD